MLRSLQKIFEDLREMQRELRANLAGFERGLDTESVTTGSHPATSSGTEPSLNFMSTADEGAGAIPLQPPCSSETERVRTSTPLAVPAGDSPAQSQAWGSELNSALGLDDTVRTGGEGMPPFEPRSHAPPTFSSSATGMAAGEGVDLLRGSLGADYALTSEYGATSEGSSPASSGEPVAPRREGSSDLDRRHPEARDAADELQGAGRLTQKFEDGLARAKRDLEAFKRQFAALLGSPSASDSASPAPAAAPARASGSRPHAPHPTPATAYRAPPASPPKYSRAVEAGTSISPSRAKVTCRQLADAAPCAR